MSTRTRRARGLEAVAEAAANSPVAVHLVTIDGIPRAFLSSAEFAATCGVRVERVRELIATGEIRTVDFHTQAYRIPVSEIARWQAKATDPAA